MSNFSGLLASDIRFWFLRHNQFLDVTITFPNCDIKLDYEAETIVESRTASLKPMKVGQGNCLLPKTNSEFF